MMSMMFDDELEMGRRVIDGKKERHPEGCGGGRQLSIPMRPRVVLSCKTWVDDLGVGEFQLKPHRAALKHGCSRACQERDSPIRGSLLPTNHGVCRPRILVFFWQEHRPLYLSNHRYTCATPTSSGISFEASDSFFTFFPSNYWPYCSCKLFWVKGRFEASCSLCLTPPIDGKACLLRY
jgi:hypothetical protein